MDQGDNMDQSLQRGDVLELLEQLGAESDEEVLAAARRLDEMVKAADLSWDDLLVPSPGAAPEDEEDEAADEWGAEDDFDAEEEAGDEGEGDEADTGDEDGKGNAALALVKELLALKSISEELREDLQGYKADIAAGRLAAGDRRYLQALHKRLKGR